MLGGWRRHFERFPPDGADRLLSAIYSLLFDAATKPGTPVPDDAQSRPWAYTPAQHRAAQRRREERAKAKPAAPTMTDKTLRT